MHKTISQYLDEKLKSTTVKDTIFVLKENEYIEAEFSLQLDGATGFPVNSVPIHLQGAGKGTYNEETKTTYIPQPAVEGFATILISGFI
jgi:hypothetical protein